MKDLSMHIMDIVQNSLSAKATMITIEIIENMDEDSYIINIKDDGIGMSRDFVSTVTDPYVTTRTTRKIGLGIPLLKQNAERTGGQFTIDSEEGKGTKVKAEFIFMHPDRLPIGDIAGTVVLLCAANPNVTIHYHHVTNSGEYNFDTTEILETLDGISISEPSVIKFLKEMINENLQMIGISR